MMQIQEQKDAPFKHHPWDIDVTDNAKTTSGSHTYYFKKGITYRGTLIAKDSGETNKPITLSIDPNWGKGEAYIFGSERIIGGWKKCSGTECPEIAKEVVDKTWYQDFNISYVPMMLYELQKDETIKLNIARSPNWEITNADNPREHWWEWTGQVYEVKLILDSVDDFEIGELVQGKGKWIDKEEDKLNITEGINTIIDKGTNFIVINISKTQKGEFEKILK